MHFCHSILGVAGVFPALETVLKPLARQKRAGFEGQTKGIFGGIAALSLQKWPQAGTKRCLFMAAERF